MNVSVEIKPIHCDTEGCSAKDLPRIDVKKRLLKIPYYSYDVIDIRGWYLSGSEYHMIQEYCKEGIIRGKRDMFLRFTNCYIDCSDKSFYEEEKEKIININRFELLDFSK